MRCAAPAVRAARSRSPSVAQTAAIPSSASGNGGVAPALTNTKRRSERVERVSKVLLQAKDFAK